MTAEQRTFSTPMMQQYAQIKAEHADCLLFFRLGDFYELFLEDALVGARVLGITLTRRPRGKDGEIPMAGVPYHSASGYIAKLIKAGYKVAICEQQSPPDQKGIVDRAVVRVITPGTQLDETGLSDKTHNYLCTFTWDSDVVAYAVADITTGDLTVLEIPHQGAPESLLLSQIVRHRPTECVVPASLYQNAAAQELIKQCEGLWAHALDMWESDSAILQKQLCSLWQLTTLESVHLHDKHLSQQCIANLVNYIAATQKEAEVVFRLVQTTDPRQLMVADAYTVRNLEILEPLRGSQMAHTLLGCLDRTYTAVGGRTLREWLTHPSTQLEIIQSRHDAIQWWIENYDQLQTQLVHRFRQFFDIQRMTSKILYRVSVPADLVRLAESLVSAQECVSVFRQFDVGSIKYLDSLINILDLESPKACAQEIRAVLEMVSADEQSGRTRVVRFKYGALPELDKIAQQIDAITSELEEYEHELKESLAIATLKVSSNSVFGFYIEVSKSYKQKVPDTFERLQTLVNAERYVTPELKKKYTQFIRLTTEHEQVEKQALIQLQDRVKEAYQEIMAVARSMGQLDALWSLASVAREYQYVRPTMGSEEFLLTQARHPVLEQLCQNSDTPCVPNTTEFPKRGPKMHLLTGPNMAGKSVYMRQVALCIWMAQSGSFVPAASASIPVFDKIFVRSGAADSIATGLSTFMVEMVETAALLRSATESSFVILDEVGRGTSTYDGMSIAWAVTEYLVQHVACRCIFATHYHELQVLASEYPEQIQNWTMQVFSGPEGPVFVHTLAPGAAEQSYGIWVAQMAGVPEVVLQRSRELLQKWESNHHPQSTQQVRVKITKKKAEKHPVLTALQAIDPDELSPKEALQQIYSLRHLMEKTQ